jgi:hypothetical protein
MDEYFGGALKEFLEPGMGSPYLYERCECQQRGGTTDMNATRAVAAVALSAVSMTANAFLLRRWVPELDQTSN